MIKVREVIRMKIPFPSLDSDLACTAHMYICIEAGEPRYKFVKCQTLKPYMLLKPLLSYYCDEEPDIRRNPFRRVTRIDCEKVFVTTGVEYEEGLKTLQRGDISEELYEEIRERLSQAFPQEIELEEAELISLNSKITKKR